DLLGRALLAPLALGDERRGRALELRGPPLVDRAEGSEQLDALAEIRAHRVEDADDREVLAERGAPLLDVVAAADHVDQRHPRPAGPAQDLHLRFVLASVWTAAIDDVEDARAVRDRPQQLALVAKAWIVGVGRQELADDGRALAGAAVVRLEPGERLARTLEARRVDQLVERLAVEPERIDARVHGRAGMRRDRDRLVLGQRRDDAALAFVRV